jgi:hypothetical protein
MINTKPFIMNTKKPCPWRKLTFDMLPFSLGGIRNELQARPLIMSLIINSTFGTFVCDNGEASC